MDRDAHEGEFLFSKSLLGLLRGFPVDHGRSGNSHPRGSEGEMIVDITKKLILLREKAEHGLESFESWVNVSIPRLMTMMLLMP
jgi:hypothetical protein